MHRPRNHRKPKNHRMQQPENVVCTNPEQHRTTTQKTQTDQPKKKKKPRTSAQKTLTNQPRKHKPTTENIPSETNQPRKNRKRIKRQTKPENTENGSLVSRSTNPSCSNAEIVKPMTLRCRDRDFWVLVFAPISRS